MSISYGDVLVASERLLARSDGVLYERKRLKLNSFLWGKNAAADHSIVKIRRY